MQSLLLLSNSTNFGGGYLDHAMKEILTLLGACRRIAFVPFALHNRKGYTVRVRDRFTSEGIDVEEIVEGSDGVNAVEGAAALFVGGGNTFRLLDGLQRSRLLEPIRRRVDAGMPYLGSSAGSVIAAPTIKTTNDMPIVQPQWFEALGVVPFQINAHYLDPDPGSTHMGETREQRLREFHEENDTPVVGLREGAWLRVVGPATHIGGGPGGARLFRRGHDPIELGPGDPLDPLLRA